MQKQLKKVMSSLLCVMTPHSSFRNLNLYTRITKILGRYHYRDNSSHFRVAKLRVVISFIFKHFCSEDSNSHGH